MAPVAGMRLPSPSNVTRSMSSRSASSPLRPTSAKVCAPPSRRMWPRSNSARSTAGRGSRT
eukprot:7211583-Alexandrium_andersonii.AAC.1